MTSYRITSGGTQEWPTRDYSLEEIQAHARRDNRFIRDGYGRDRIRDARKLKAMDRKGRRKPVIFSAIDLEEEPVKPFGAR